VWGSSFIIMKKALTVYSDVELGTLRMVFASAVMLPFALKGFRKITRKQWFYLVLFGLLGNTFPAYLFAKAQTHIDSSLAGILNALTPIFVLIIGLVFYHLKVTIINIIGLFLGLIGAAAIIYTSGEGQINLNFQYSGYIILATIFYSININLVKYKLADLDSIKIGIYGFSILFVPLTLILIFATPFIQTVQQPGALPILMYPLILGVVCSAAAIVAFNTLIHMSSTIFASSVTYLIPIVALILGVLDGEKFSLWTGVWIITIIVGVLLVNKKK